MGCSPSLYKQELTGATLEVCFGTFATPNFRSIKMPAKRSKRVCLSLTVQEFSTLKKRSKNVPLAIFIRESMLSNKFLANETPEEVLESIPISIGLMNKVLSATKNKDQSQKITRAISNLSKALTLLLRGYVK